MKEYLPWSSEALNIAKEKYKNGEMSILDIQLGGRCNNHCQYCDSPDRNKECSIDFNHLYQLVETATKEGRRFDWVFVCGLGEPLFEKNKEHMLFILQMCEQFNMRCCIFTNGNQMDDEILDYVGRGILFPNIKIDTFDKHVAAKLYGSSASNVDNTFSAMNRLFQLGERDDYLHYHYAASIVPTKKNYNEIIDIVQQCIDKNMFPLLGELEFAGLAKEQFANLYLPEEELYTLKAEIESLFGPYRIPVCPSVIAGFHILYNGQIAVDRKSGLSCSWFWLNDPDVIELCNVNSITSFKEAEVLIFNYRNKAFDNMRQIAATIRERPFGGCGGNIKDLANEYIELQESLLSK